MLWVADCSLDGSRESRDRGHVRARVASSRERTDADMDRLHSLQRISIDRSASLVQSVNHIRAASQGKKEPEDIKVRESAGRMRGQKREGDESDYFGGKVDCGNMSVRARGDRRGEGGRM